MEILVEPLGFTGACGILTGWEEPAGASGADPLPNEEYLETFDEAFGALALTLITEGVEAGDISAVRGVVVRSPESMKNSPRAATSVLVMRIVERIELGKTNMRLGACPTKFGEGAVFSPARALAGNKNDRGRDARGKACSNRIVCCNSVNCC
jgi:hypothetical protein